MAVKHPNSRPITFHQAPSNLARAQGTQAAEYMSSGKQSIGSYYQSETSQKVASGLTIVEEDLLMEHVLGISIKDPTFRKQVVDFFTDIDLKVPYERGVTLETGLLENNEKPVAKDNMPISPIDYVKYRQASGHPWVAQSKEEAEGDASKKFYIFDKNNVQSKGSEKRKNRDAAMETYLKLIKEPSMVSQMLTVLGIDPRLFTGKDADDLRIEALREKLDENPVKFNEEYAAGELETRYLIKTMLTVKVLKTVGSRFFDVESDKLIGSSLEEVIYWFKDEDNSDSVVAMKARMQEALAADPTKEKRMTKFD